MTGRVEAERALIKSLLLWPERMEEVQRVLDAKHFQHELNRQMFVLLCENRLELASSAMAETFEQISANADHIQHYVRSIIESWRREQVIVAATEILRAAHDDSAAIDEVIAIGREKLLAV